jgi:DNA-binding response OmpR family regulator
MPKYSEGDFGECMLDGLISRIEKLFRKVRRAGMEQRTVVAVTRNQRDLNDMRVLGIQQSWTIRFATTLAQALQARPRSGICVVVYDRTVSRADWRDAVESLCAWECPVFCILLSDSAGPALRNAVLDSGGYDIARKPMDPAELAALIRAAMALAAEIDSCEAPMTV